METKETRLADRITKGRVIIASYPDNSVVFENLNGEISGDIICEPPLGWDKSMENWQSHAELIAEAFNVTNSCGYTPKELLEQRNEAIEIIKSLEITDDYHAAVRIEEFLKKYQP